MGRLASFLHLAARKGGKPEPIRPAGTVTDEQATAAGAVIAKALRAWLHDCQEADAVLDLPATPELTAARATYETWRLEQPVAERQRIEGEGRRARDDIMGELRRLRTARATQLWEERRREREAVATAQQTPTLPLDASTAGESVPGAAPELAPIGNNPEPPRGRTLLSGVDLSIPVDARDRLGSFDVARQVAPWPEERGCVAPRGSHCTCGRPGCSG